MIARLARVKAVGIPSEHEEQTALFEWARYATRHFPELGLLHAIPNGTAATSGREAARAKCAGRRAGVPDLCLPVARQGFHGLYIEMKRRDGVPSDLSQEQRLWLVKLTEQGYRAVMCPGCEAARAEILNYLDVVS